MAQKMLRDYLQETEDALSSERIEDALANCQHILAYFPESLEAQRLLGEVYLAQGRMEDAQQSFDWVLTNDPENVIAYCNRALVSEYQSDFDTALDCYQQAYELSRGNSQIRQKFNRLSEKAGQQGFMFSRAGLARLYMRGDLLTQAIQEWDAVIATTPDRLDARTGLLETYWRDGLPEKVEQLAGQILQDYPGCLKALLLLAQVTLPRDGARARELMQRAETLDPDFQMAQELFADLMAGQPADPFLALLKKPPATFDTAERFDFTEFPTSEAPAAPHVEEFVPSVSALDAAPFGTFSNSPDPLANWGNDRNWDNATTLIKPPSQPLPAQNAWGTPEQVDALAASGAGNGAAIPESAWSEEFANATPTVESDVTHLAPWNTHASSDAQPAQTASFDEPWSALHDALSGLETGAVPATGAPASSPWGDLGAFASPAAEPQNPWDFAAPPAGTASQPQENPFASAWGFSPDESAAPSPPAWLSMLTQNERQQMSGMMAPVAPQETPASSAPAPEPTPSVAESAVPAFDSASILEPPAPATPASVSPSTHRNETAAEPPASEDDDEFSFSPAWLRSLGATELDNDEAEVELPVQQQQPAASVVPEPAPAHQEWEAPVPEHSHSSDSWYTPAASQPESFSQVAQQTPDTTEQQPEPAYGAWQDASNEAQTDSSSYENWGLGDVFPAARAAEYNSWKAQEPESSLQQAPYSTWQQEQPEAQSQATAHATWGASVPDAETTASFSQTPPAAEETSQPTSTAASDYQTMAQSSSAIYERVAAAYEAWQASGKQSDATNRIGQNLATTLEELEQKLRSQGFTSLAPNSLASIARGEAEAKETASTPTEFPEAQPQVTETQQQPSLSSALAELGGFTQPQPQQPTITAANTPSAPAEPEYSYMQPQEEPQWLQALRSTPPAAPRPAQIAASAEPAPADPVFSSPSPTLTSVVPTTPIPQELPQTPPVRIEAVPGPVFHPTTAPAPVGREQSEALKIPEAYANPLLENELETTMKRPAIRLQPMQSRSTALHEPVPALTKTTISERHEQPASKPSSASQSYHDRLLQGYQHQLVGDYDEAMQEYRVIIRNAPELLGDVVSNVRALLKLAPRYSAGYRVLGDAYMRQGEYLQAMEAYNKALTMAKKSKN